MDMENMKPKKNTVAQDLIEGFRELNEALASGGDLGQKFNCYQLELDLQPERYTPELVKETRKVLSASQAMFAMFLGVSVKTVSEWEQGRSNPQDIACRFMDEIRKNPEHYRDRMKKSVVPKNRRSATA